MQKRDLPPDSLASTRKKTGFCRGARMGAREVLNGLFVLVNSLGGCDRESHERERFCLGQAVMEENRFFNHLMYT
jgi:hypothetical protein